MSRQTPALDRNFPALKAWELNFPLLPVVNSKKQLLGVVTRELLEKALLNSGIGLENYRRGRNQCEPGLTMGTDWPEAKELSLPVKAVEGSELLRQRTEMLHKLGFKTYSPKMLDLVELTLRVAKVKSTVLITGESGVGKELFAKLLHDQSPRKLDPFIKVNCGAIPENLLESELFGYESGAFTGASRHGKPGMFELAHGGTLFLDEIAELTLSLQVKILRALQEQEFLRVGGTKIRKVNIRFIAATNRDLEKMVEEGKFREDLYFRLNVIPLSVPPLRERREDILPLVHHFQQRFTLVLDTQKDFAPEVLKAFYNYSWPGNVRELENIIERLLVITPGLVVFREHLPARILAGGKMYPR